MACKKSTCQRTSKGVATKAAKILRGEKATKAAEQSVAGAALGARKNCKKK